MINIFLKITPIVLMFNLTACNIDNNAPSYINEPYNYDSSDYVIEDEPYFKYAWHFAYDKKFARSYNIKKDAHVDI